MTIADFTETEQWLVGNALNERYGKAVELQLADVEVRLTQADRELTSCPALFWSERGANFVIVKTGDKRYRAQFYYRLHQQFGTGVKDFDDISECVVTLLQVQADHEAKEKQNQSPG